MRQVVLSRLNGVLLRLGKAHQLYKKDAISTREMEKQVSETLDDLRSLRDFVEKQEKL